MRVVCSYTNNAVVQVEKSPDVGVGTPMNGKFVIPVPEGSNIALDSSSYLSPVDGGDVSSLSMQALLAQYPQYGNIVFNTLLSASDVAEIDLAATLPTGEIVRCQTGRGAGPLPTGQAANTTAILAQNNAVAPAKPGLLITDTIDISAISPAGSNDYMVYWEIYEFSTSQDVRSSYGATTGDNAPAIRTLTETDQEPAALSVYLSTDDGVTYTQVNRLEPCTSCVPGPLLRLAFKNTGSSKIYLAAFAIMWV